MKRIGSALLQALLCCYCGACLVIPHAQAQNLLNQIQKRGELVIATDATYPPFEFVEKEMLQGFDIELGNAIGKELGVKTRWANLEWAGVLGSLESGKCDLAMAGVTITEERKKKGYLFSRPYFLSGQVMICRQNETRIRTGDDLKKMRVAVQVQTTGQTAAERLGVPAAQMQKFDALHDALTDVRNGKSDAAIGDLPALRELIRKNYPELKIVGGVLVEENVGIVAWRSEAPLVSAVNRALERIMTDGRYAAMYERWLRERLSTKVLGGLDRVRNAGSAVPELSETADTSAASAAPSAAGGSGLSIRWNILGEAFPILLQGAKVTLLLTLLTLALGVPAGLGIALLRISRLRALRWLAVTYIELARGTPLLMQIYLIYFVLPALKLQFDPLTAGVIALSANAAAYIAEIFRAGIQSIDVGQMEAARALGMDYLQAMRWVILPQTLRRTLPPLTNEAIALLKDSSLVSVVAVEELMRKGKEIATNSGSATTIYLAIAVLYLGMTLPLTYLANTLELAWQPISRKPAAKGKRA